MEPDYILKADLLDIIFEKKNKDYGAYTLRKFYPERLYKSLGIIFIAATILVLAGIFYKNKTATVTQIADPVICALFEMPLDKDMLKLPQPKKHIAPSTVPLMDRQSVAVDKNSTSMVISTDADKIEIFDPTKTDNPYSDGPSASAEGSILAATGTEPAEVKDKNIPEAADIMPAFPGGIEALRKFLQRNLTNPENIEPGENVSVRIKFIVGYDGLLKGFEIMEDGGPAFNNEVIRVLKKMPPWIPGKAHGENVSVFYSVPVKFTSTE